MILNFIPVTKCAFGDRAPALLGIIFELYCTTTFDTRSLPHLGDIEQQLRIKMDKRRMIKGEQIKRLVTRFQYSGENMVFEILLRLTGQEEMVPYLKTIDYGIFRTTFSDLMEKRSENEEIYIPPTESSGLGLNPQAA